jgi:hypothetical protein
MGPAIRVRHENGELAFLQSLPPKTPAAVEACGGWMWITAALKERV